MSAETGAPLWDQWLFGNCRRGRFGQVSYQTQRASPGITLEEERELVEVVRFWPGKTGHPPQWTFGIRRLESSGRWCLFRSAQGGADEFGRPTWFSHAFVIDNLTVLPHLPFAYFESPSFLTALPGDEMRPDEPLARAALAIGDRFRLSPTPADYVNREIRSLEGRRRRAADLVSATLDTGEPVSILSPEEPVRVVLVFAVLWLVAEPAQRQRLSLCTLLSQVNLTPFAVAGWPVALGRPTDEFTHRFTTIFTGWDAEPHGEPKLPARAPLREQLGRLLHEDWSSLESGEYSSSFVQNLIAQSQPQITVWASREAALAASIKRPGAVGWLYLLVVREALGVRGKIPAAVLEGFGDSLSRNASLIAPLAELLHVASPATRAGLLPKIGEARQAPVAAALADRLQENRSGVCAWAGAQPLWGALILAELIRRDREARRTDWGEWLMSFASALGRPAQDSFARALWPRLDAPAFSEKVQLALMCKAPPPEFLAPFEADPNFARELAEGKREVRARYELSQFAPWPNLQAALACRRIVHAAGGDLAEWCEKLEAHADAFRKADAELRAFAVSRIVEAGRRHHPEFASACLKPLLARFPAVAASPEVTRLLAGQAAAGAPPAAPGALEPSPPVAGGGFPPLAEETASSVDAAPAEPAPSAEAYPPLAADLPPLSLPEPAAPLALPASVELESAFFGLAEVEDATPAEPRLPAQAEFPVAVAPPLPSLEPEEPPAFSISHAPVDPDAAPLPESLPPVSVEIAEATTLEVPEPPPTTATRPGPRRQRPAAAAFGREPRKRPAVPEPLEWQSGPKSDDVCVQAPATRSYDPGEEAETDSLPTPGQVDWLQESFANHSDRAPVHLRNRMRRLWNSRFPMIMAAIGALAAVVTLCWMLLFKPGHLAPVLFSPTPPPNRGSLPPDPAMVLETKFADALAHANLDEADEVIRQMDTANVPEERREKCVRDLNDRMALRAHKSGELQIAQQALAQGNFDGAMKMTTEGLPGTDKLFQEIEQYKNSVADLQREFTRLEHQQADLEKSQAAAAQNKDWGGFEMQWRNLQDQWQRLSTRFDPVPLEIAKRQDSAKERAAKMHELAMAGGQSPSGQLSKPAMDYIEQLRTVTSRYSSLPEPPPVAENEAAAVSWARDLVKAMNKRDAAAFIGQAHFVRTADPPMAEAESVLTPRIIAGEDLPVEEATVRQLQTQIVTDLRKRYGSKLPDDKWPKVTGKIDLETRYAILAYQIMYGSTYASKTEPTGTITSKLLLDLGIKPPSKLNKPLAR